MARNWSLAIGTVFDVPLPSGYINNINVEGGANGDLAIGMGSVGTLVSGYSVKVQPAGPNKIVLVATSDLMYFRIVDKGSVTVTGPTEASSMNPQQEFFVDSAKDVLDFGAGYLASRSAVTGLSSALSTSGVLSSGVAMTTARAVGSVLPGLAGAGMLLLAGQVALNMSKLAVSTPAQPVSIKVTSVKTYVRVFPPTYQPDGTQTTPTSGSGGGASSDSPPKSNYDETAQYFASYPSWNGGTRHPHEQIFMNGIINIFDDIIINEVEKAGGSFTPQQWNSFANDPTNNPFWANFKQSLTETFQAMTEKRANLSVYNEINELNKSLQKISNSLSSLSDLKIPDFEQLFKSYFSHSKTVNGTETILNLPAILDSKDFSTNVIELSGGDML